MKLFIFPDSVRRDNAEENIKLNIDGDGTVKYFV